MDALAFLLIAMLVLGTWVAKLHLRLTRMSSVGPETISVDPETVHLRYDPLRPDSVGRWTAFIPGRARGDGRTPIEALESLGHAVNLPGATP